MSPHICKNSLEIELGYDERLGITFNNNSLLSLYGKLYQEYAEPSFGLGSAPATRWRDGSPKWHGLESRKKYTQHLYKSIDRQLSG